MVCTFDLENFGNGNSFPSAEDYGNGNPFLSAVWTFEERRSVAHQCGWVALLAE